MTTTQIFSRLLEFFKLFYFWIKKIIRKRIRKMIILLTSYRANTKPNLI